MFLNLVWHHFIIIVCSIFHKRYLRIVLSFRNICVVWGWSEAYTSLNASSLWRFAPFHKTGTTATTGEGPGITPYRFDSSPVKPTDPGFFITNIFLINFRSTQILCSFMFCFWLCCISRICFTYAFRGAFQA